MKVRLLTEEQKNLLVGRSFDGVQLFNPIKDINNNWIISNEEINQCNNSIGIEFIYGLLEIDYNPIIIDIL